MTAPFVKIDNWSDIPNAIARMQIAGADHRVPGLRALYHGRIAYWEPQRVGSSGSCKRFIAAARKPALVVLGDDDDLRSGPDGWPVARRLLEWARLVAVHGAGAQVCSYETFVLAAELVGRVLLIECGTQHLEQWKRAAERWAPRAVKQSIELPPGTVQPVPTSPGSLH